MASKQVSHAILLISISVFQAALSATSSVVVVGTVFCDTCSQHRFSETSSYYIPGACVAVECSINRKTSGSISMKGTTDEYGEFRLEIPCMLHSLERCSVHVLGSPESSCNIPSVTTSGPLNSKWNIHLEGDGTYNAGLFSYRPLKVPAMCYKPSPLNYLRLRGRAALEGGSPPAPSLIPNLPGSNFPGFPQPINPGGSPSSPLLQIPPFPFAVPSPPPAKEGDASPTNAESPLAALSPSSPRQPVLTFPVIPSISVPFLRPPSFTFLFPPIPFLTPSPPTSPTGHQSP